MNNKESLTKILQEILSEKPNFFLPSQFHVLSWKSQKVEGALITKINGQRYIGFLRKDRKGQEYWKYKILTENSSAANPPPSALKNDYGKANNSIEQPANQQSN